MLPFLDVRHCLISGGRRAQTGFLFSHPESTSFQPSATEKASSERKLAFAQPGSPERSAPALSCPSLHCFGLADIFPRRTLHLGLLLNMYSLFNSHPYRTQNSHSKTFSSKGLHLFIFILRVNSRRRVLPCNHMT